jgi:hypothetical protein
MPVGIAVAFTTLQARSREAKFQCLGDRLPLSRSPDFPRSRGKHPYLNSRDAGLTLRVKSPYDEWVGSFMSGARRGCANAAASQIFVSLVAPSFNGRTPASGAGYRGSNPWGAANLIFSSGHCFQHVEQRTVECSKSQIQMSTLLLVDKRIKCDMWKGQGFQSPIVTVRIAVSKRGIKTMIRHRAQLSGYRH